MSRIEKFKKVLGPTILALGSVIWGLSFVVQSEGGDIGTFTFQTFRLTLATLSIGIAFLISRLATKKSSAKKNEKPVTVLSADEKKKRNKRNLVAILLCGTALGIASNLQQLGIDLQGKDVSAGRAGFLTTLYIILVPILGVLLKKHIGLKSWISVAVGVVGLYLISVKPGTIASVSKADIVLLLCALFYAFQIISIDSFSDVDGLMLAFGEFFIATIFAIVLMFILEGVPDMTEVVDYKWLLLYSGVLSGGVAFTFQIYGQKMTPPVLASLLMSMESVFSALSDWIIRGNKLNARELTGCAVMFAAIILIQLPERKSKTDTSDSEQKEV